MSKTSKSLNSQMKQLKESAGALQASINFQKIIEKQQQVIHSLQDEILLLKSYITIQRVSSSSDSFCGETSTISIISSNDESINRDFEQSIHNSFKNYEKMIKDIIDVLQLKELSDLDDPLILETIKKIKESSTRKQEPIFVQRIKEIKVPITVQKIIEKTVDRIVQKIVYVEKIVEKPSFFKEKRSEMYAERLEYDNEEHEPTLNKTFSEKNIANKNSQSYREEKYQDRTRYDQYKKPETGGNLIKKRSEQPIKNYGYRKDYY